MFKKKKSKEVKVEQPVPVAAPEPKQIEEELPEIEPKEELTEEVDAELGMGTNEPELDFADSLTQLINKHINTTPIVTIKSQLRQSVDELNRFEIINELVTPNDNEDKSNGK